MLVAIAIPIFTNQLKKSRLATNQANARSAYAAVQTELLAEEKTSGLDTYTVSTGKTTGTISAASPQSITTMPQDWNLTDNANLGEGTATAWTVSVADDGKVSFGPTGL